MTKTTNYQLPKWEKTDRIQMKDFNDMTATLDAALKANADAIADCGNCRMSMLAYTGNGKYNDAENGSYITEINFTAICSTTLTPAAATSTSSLSHGAARCCSSKARSIRATR